MAYHFRTHQLIEVTSGGDVLHNPMPFTAGNSSPAIQLELTPFLFSFQNVMYAAWVDTAGAVDISSSPDGVNWTWLGTVPSPGTAVSRLTLAAFNG